MDTVKRIANRTLREPALLVGVVLAVANLLGVDPEAAESMAAAIRSGLAFLALVVVRQTVSGPKDPLGLEDQEG